MSEHRDDQWPIGTRVVIRAPGTWQDGLTGVVYAHPKAWLDRTTIELDRGGRALAFNASLRTTTKVHRGRTRPSEPASSREQL